MKSEITAPQTLTKASIKSPERESGENRKSNISSYVMDLDFHLHNFSVLDSPIASIPARLTRKRDNKSIV